MNIDKLTRLTSAAKSALEKTEPLLLLDFGSAQLRRYFKVGTSVARRVVENDLASSEARRDILHFRLISQGMIAFGTLAGREAEAEPEPGSHFPGMDRWLCLANCAGLYNKCKGRGDDDEDDEAQAEGEEGEEPDDEGDEDDVAGLGCYLAYMSCVAGCTPPVS